MSVQIQKVEIDCRELTDWQAFHSVFAAKLGFPDYYGRNMNAWYDCFSSLSDESTVLKLSEGDVVWLDLKHFKDLQSQQPELAEAILEGAAFVNFGLDEERRRAIARPWTLLGAVAVFCIRIRHMLSIQNLHVTIGDKPILNGLTLDVPAGEVHAIMGPNGAGKSMLWYSDPRRSR